jgi:cbb3-type cytochrome oxidase subunit 3
MTNIDWFGTILVVVIFIIIATAYIYAFRPKNKKKFEQYAHIPLDD